MKIASSYPVTISFNFARFINLLTNLMAIEK